MEDLNVKEVSEEKAEETAVMTEAPSLDSVKEVFAAMAKENGGEFPVDGEEAALRFTQLGSKLVREARLADVFFACGGHVDMLGVKEGKAPRKTAIEAVVEEMYHEYWIDSAAAGQICIDFLDALCGEAEKEESLCQLGDRYYSGNGVPQDKEKAAELYREAGENGDVTAQYTLGYMYDKGDGIEKDRDVAICWYEKAAENGHEAAGNRLNILKGSRAAENAAPAEAAPKKKKGFFGR